MGSMECRGEICVGEGSEMVMGGDKVEISVEVMYGVGLKVGLGLGMGEGGGRVGCGEISEIVE